MFLTADSVYITETWRELRDKIPLNAREAFSDGVHH